ncbi:hypothetical protein [Enterobacter sp. R1(2018)]|uniref:hypothetical protein n=1 Tax=Enterobacter sp. R1(2018) TaxID=2447891 RepID=UPI000EAF1C33|nr:hypothetical protein [Enterobacter sp. R1(2018)]RKQ38368.1 hypothetical protein D8M09_17335 [Enterobacter sp. R1(2018)]
MNITTDDYDVINAYAGIDKSWHDRVSTTEGLNRMIDLSSKISTALIVAARHGSMKEGGSHG